MANNYTGFSVEVTIHPETLSWVQEKQEADEEEMYGFDIYIEENSVVIASTDGDAEQAINFIQSLLCEEKKYDDSDKLVLFEYAFTCDKPRVDEFGGATWLIFADMVYEMEKQEWINSILQLRAMAKSS